jgi:vacuolar-type H+-ATPase catalytic subunit A/Vma1
VRCCAVQVAKIIREDFLAQNAYSPYDPCCPFYKSVWMLKNIILFYTLAIKSVELSGNDRKITLNAIKNVRPLPPARGLRTNCCSHRCWTLTRQCR